MIMYSQEPKVTCADPEGWAEGTDPTPPPKNHKHIGFLSHTGPDYLKNQNSIQC